MIAAWCIEGRDVREGRGVKSPAAMYRLSFGDTVAQRHLHHVFHSQSHLPSRFLGFRRNPSSHVSPFPFGLVEDAVHSQSPEPCGNMPVTCWLNLAARRYHVGLDVVAGVTSASSGWRSSQSTLTGGAPLHEQWQGARLRRHAWRWQA